MNSHLRTLIILSVIFIALFTIYLLIKPDKSKPLGISVFPPGGPYIPPDNSKCGKDIVKTSETQTCANVCSSDLYTETLIPNNKEVWYNGTKLTPGQSYCLPKQNSEVLTSCGTYTGKIIYSNSGWECQCKYPDIYSGPSCTTQKACTDKNGHAVGKLLKNGVILNDPPLSDPYGAICQCPTGYYYEDSDPLRCKEDLCYAGDSDVNSPVYFDTKSQTCKCDNEHTVRSNVTGFCYPVEGYQTSTTCSPDKLTGNCSCNNVFLQIMPDNRVLGVFFRRDNDIFITAKIGEIIYKIRVNEVLEDDMKQTLPNTLKNIKGAMVEFGLMQYTDLNPSDYPGSLLSYMRQSYPQFTEESAATYFVNSLVKNMFSIPCNSFFYNRPDVSTQCNDAFYASSDNNNKNGTMCFQPIKNAREQCGGYGTAVLDAFDPEGYHCECDKDDCVYQGVRTDELNGHKIYSCERAYKCQGESCTHSSECKSYPSGFGIHECNRKCVWSGGMACGADTDFWC